MLQFTVTPRGLYFKALHVGKFGILAMISGVILIFWAMGINGSYNLALQHISELGIGPGGSGIVFDLGLISAGALAIPFFIGLGKILDREATNQRVRKRTVNCSILACVSLIGTGLFPMHDTLLIPHFIFAFLFFINGLLFCVQFSYLMAKDDRFSRAHAYLGYFVAIFFGIYLATPWMGLTEWLVFFSIVFWMVITSGYVCYNKL